MNLFLSRRLILLCLYCWTHSQSLSLFFLGIEGAFQSWRGWVFSPNTLIFLITVNQPFSFSVFPECHFLIRFATVLWCGLHHASVHPLRFLADRVARGYLYFQQMLGPWFFHLRLLERAVRMSEPTEDPLWTSYSSNSSTVFPVKSLKKHKQVQLRKSLDILCDGNTNTFSLFCVINF